MDTNVVELDACSETEDHADQDPVGPKKQLKSWIYSHFGPQKNSKFSCNYCKKELAVDKSGSTGNLIRHYQKCNKQHLKNSSNQPKITECALNSKFSNEKFHELIVENLILNNQSFHSVESASFTKLASYGRPNTATVPGADKVKSIVLRLYESHKKSLIEKLNSHQGKFSVVVDAWTSKTSYSFHGILVCWIDAHWKFNEVFLDLDILRGEHTGQTLAKSLIKVLEEFGILNRINGVTSDNASNCDKMFTELETELGLKGIEFNASAQRVRCLAHICNLACQDAIGFLKTVSAKEVSCSGSNSGTVESDAEDFELSSSSDDEYLEAVDIPPAKASLSIYSRVRLTISKIRNCGRFSRKYKHACAILNMDYLSLRLDVTTRWNSTFHMFERIIKMQKPVNFVINSFDELQSLALSDSDWFLLERMMKLLEPFETVTKLLSKGKNPSMALTAAVYHHLYTHLENFQKISSNTCMAEAIEAAISKLNKYYPDSDGLVYIVGLVLDPRCKMEWYKLAKTPNDVVKKNKKIALDYWEAHYKPQPTDDLEQVEEVETDLIAQQMKRAKMEKRDEFRCYLGTAVAEAKTFPNVLEWWKANEGAFPNLSKMAKDFLAVSGTGVPIERTFSLGSDLLAPKRRRLKDETIRESISLKCWLKFQSQDSYFDSKLQAVKDKFFGYV